MEILAQIKETADIAEEAIKASTSGEILVAVLVILAGSLWAGIYIWKVAIPNSRAIQESIDSLQETIAVLTKAIDQQEVIRQFQETQSTTNMQMLLKTNDCMTTVSAELNALRAEVNSFNTMVTRVVENNTKALDHIARKYGSNSDN